MGSLIIFFLRLFRTFRELENLAQAQARAIEQADKELQCCQEANRELVSEKTLLEDRLDSAISDKDKLWQVMQEALDGERDALRMTVNHAVQRAGGGVPYPESHALPANRVAQPQKSGPIGRRARVLPSEMALRQEMNNIREFARSMSGTVTAEE
jgi:hypothetical protein